LLRRLAVSNSDDERLTALWALGLLADHAVWDHEPSPATGTGGFVFGAALGHVIPVRCEGRGSNRE
jgi:hypothetical protein